MPRRSPRWSRDPSPLRQARLARNWTLEDVVEEIDLRTPGGQSGVTPSMVSGWELARHTTSIGHRKTLCEIYGRPPRELFAFQDEQLPAQAGLGLLTGFIELQQAAVPGGDRVALA
jgi:transcriptional regulator with XRE-family HTH domain